MKIRIFLTAFCMILTVSKGFAQRSFYTIAENKLLNENRIGIWTDIDFSCTNISFPQPESNAEPATKKFTKTVRFTVVKLKIHKDGDYGAEGAGDFTWIMKVNGEIISEEKNEIDLNTGAVHTIDRSISLTLHESVTQQVVFEAFIIERDGWFSGKDDVLPPISVTYYLNELIKSKEKISESRRVNLEGSPDVEVFYSIEVMD